MDDIQNKRTWGPARMQRIMAAREAWKKRHPSKKNDLYCGAGIDAGVFIAGVRIFVLMPDSVGGMSMTADATTPYGGCYVDPTLQMQRSRATKEEALDAAVAEFEQQCNSL